MVAVRANSSMARISLGVPRSADLKAVLMPEEMAMDVNHQAGTWVSEPPAVLMEPSSASRMAVS